MCKTELKERTLYYDGTTVVEEHDLLKWIDRGVSKLGVRHISPNIKQYNRVVHQPNKRIVIKEDCDPLSFNWVLPETYINLDVRKYVFQRFIEIYSSDNTISDNDLEIRIDRINTELALYEKLNLYPVLRAIIYIINTLQDRNIVWGVGRGSSVSSYVLYIIGVHDVDSVKYDLDFADFLRETGD